MMTHSSWHDDIRREFALEFAENSNQQTNWQTAVITSLSRVSFFSRPTSTSILHCVETLHKKLFSYIFLLIGS